MSACIYHIFSFDVMLFSFVKCYSSIGKEANTFEPDKNREIS